MLVITANDPGILDVHFRYLIVDTVVVQAPVAAQFGPVYTAPGFLARLSLQPIVE